MPWFLAPLLQPAASLLAARLAQLETAGGHLVVVTILLPEALAGTEVQAYLLRGRPLAAAAVAAAVTLAAVATAAEKTAVTVAAPTRSVLPVRGIRPGHGKVAGGETKSLMRLNARSSRPWQAFELGKMWCSKI